MKNDNTLKCPQCGSVIDVSQVLYQQLQAQINQEFVQKSKEQEKKYLEKEKELENQKEILQNAKKEIDQRIEQELEKKLKVEKEAFSKQIREKLTDENSQLIKNLQEELNLKSAQVKELNLAKAEIEKIKREKNELSEKITLEKQKELNEILQSEKNKIKTQAQEENLLKLREKEKLIDDLKNQLSQANRKAEQGSTQLQGEIQELELENILKETFIYDDISEVKKGQRGADTIQIVKTQQGATCGKIYFESKRTKNFDNNWLQKLRDDNLEVKADILVLVSAVLPEGENRFFYKEGVWICSLAEVKPLVMVLRHWLLNVHAVTITQQGREGKMAELYNYLTSAEFALQFGAIIEGFRDIQQNYADEKLRMQKIWKEREKQLDKILGNAVSFYGSIKGIAGKSIPDIKFLEADKNLLE